MNPPPSEVASAVVGRKSRRPPGQAPTADRVLPVAAELFRRKGYAASSTRELSELLGINKATLYHHIDGKEDLLVAICRDSLSRIIEVVSQVARTEPPETRLRAVIHSHLASALNNRDMHAVMLTELRVLSTDHRAEIVQLRDDYEALLRQVIVADQEEGRLDPQIDSKYLTLALLNLLNWTIFWFDPAGEQTVPELGESFARIFLDGARPSGAPRAAAPDTP
jgi:AcrR family transcriptional regulator